MRPADRIITELPLKELFNDSGSVEAVRLRELNADDVRELLQANSLRFVVANCGAKPVWIAEPQRFEFWKSEVLPHLVDAKDGADLGSFPGGYGYFATEWRCPDGAPVVLLEMVH